MKPIKILLVEDNPDHIELILRAFKSEHLSCEIHVVKDGKQAIDFMYGKGEYRERADCSRPGLILLDVKLPKVDGFEVLKKIKGDPQLKSIPVIILTTSAREDDIARGYMEGANSYVTKPVKFREFIQKIRDLQRYWILTNTLPP